MADKYLEELSITTGLNMMDVLYLVRLPDTDPNDYQVTWQSVMNQIEVDLVFPHPMSYHTDATGGAPGFTGDVWRFNASSLKWVQQKLSYLDLVDVPLTFPPDAHDLDFHSDVDLTTVSPVGGDALVYDGADWIPGSAGSTIPDGLAQLQELGQATHRQEITHGISVVGGTEIRYTIDNEDDPGGGVDFYMRDGVLYELDTPEYVVLPPGTDINPILYWIYMEIVGSTPTLKYTTDILVAFGANASLLAQCELQSLATTDTDGALIFRSMTNHIETHLVHLDTMLRLNVGPFVFSGLDYSNTLTTTTQLDIDTTTGIVWGLHFHEYDTRDTALGDNLWLGFEDWEQISNITLVTIPEDSEGGTLKNRWFSLVFGLSFDTSGQHRLTLNLPSGSYNAEDDAENDVFNYTNYESPFTLENANILLYRLTMKFANNGVITLGEVVDLRADSTGAGGGGTGTSSVIVADLDLVPRFAAVELQFNNGSVTDAGSGIAQIDVAAHTAEEMTNFSSGASEQQVPKYSSGISTWIPGWVDWTEISNKPLTFPPDGGPYVPVAGGSFTGQVKFSGSAQTVIDNTGSNQLTILSTTTNAQFLLQTTVPVDGGQWQFRATTAGIFQFRQFIGGGYTNRFQMLLSGSVTLNAGDWYIPSGAALFQQTAAAGVVSMGPNISDIDTGLGWHSANRMQAIAGGTAVQEWLTNSTIFNKPIVYDSATGGVNTATTGSNVTPDTDTYNFWNLTVTANLSILAPSPAKAGYIGVMKILASGAARTVTFATGYWDSAGSNGFAIVIPSGTSALVTFTSVVSGVYLCNFTQGYGV